MSLLRDQRAFVASGRPRPGNSTRPLPVVVLQSLLAIAGFGLLTAQANAQPTQAKQTKSYLQTLISDRSSLKFVAQVGILQLEGAFRSLSGSLELDRRTQNPSLVVLKIDPAKIDLQGNQSSTLLQAPGAKPAVFTSSNIQPRAANKFLVQGQVASGAQNYLMEFIAHCPKRSQAQSYCEFKVSGPIPAIGALSGIAATDGNGTLEGKLTFQRQFDQR